MHPWRNPPSPCPNLFSSRLNLYALIRTIRSHFILLQIVANMSSDVPSTSMSSSTTAAKVVKSSKSLPPGKQSVAVDVIPAPARNTVSSQAKDRTKNKNTIDRDLSSSCDNRLNFVNLCDVVVDKSKTYVFCIANPNPDCEFELNEYLLIVKPRVSQQLSWNLPNTNPN